MAGSGSASAVPARLGRYEVRARLAGGAMGDVYEAFDPAMVRRVLLKTIRPDLLAGERGLEMIARFQRECRLLGSVAHPNVVTMYDAGQDERTGILYMVMEHVDGVDLSSLLKGGNRFPAAQVRSIALDLARALQAAHAAGIIHRDVKPSNILLTPSGQVKLTDFGIARRELDAITARGVHVGTPGYEAPEQARGEDVDARGDLYSLGTVLRQLKDGLAPGAPDPAEPPADLAETIPLGEEPSADDQELARLIASLRAPERRDRPADAASVVRLLEGVAGAPPMPQTSASPRLVPGGPLRSGRHGRAGLLPPSRSLALPLGAGVVLVLLAVLAWGVVRIVGYSLAESERILAPPSPGATPPPPSAHVPPSTVAPSSRRAESRRRVPAAPTARTPRAREGDAQATPVPERDEQFRQMEREYRDWSKEEEKKP